MRRREIWNPPASSNFFFFGLRSLRELSSPTRKGTSREWKLEPKPLDPLGISKAPILNRTRLWIFLKRQNIPECTSWTCTVQTNKTPVRPPRSSRKRKLSNFANPQSTEGRNHGHEFCASHLLFFFLFQFNSKVCNRNQSRTYTYTKHPNPRSPLGVACRCRVSLPASPPAASPPSADTGALREDSFPGRKGRPLALFAYPPRPAHRTSLKL